MNLSISYVCMASAVAALQDPKSNNPLFSRGINGICRSQRRAHHSWVLVSVATLGGWETYDDLRDASTVRRV